MAGHQRPGHTDAHDRAGERVRARGRQAQVPRADVPEDGRDKQREDHREAGARAGMNDEVLRQERHDLVGHGARDATDANQCVKRTDDADRAEQVPDAGPDDGDNRLQRVGIDDGRDSVGRVVEAIDEFKADRQGQGKSRKNAAPKLSASPNSSMISPR